MAINIQKLVEELSDAGIKFSGVGETGKVWGTDGVTEIQDRADVAAVVAAHTPAEDTTLRDAILSLAQSAVGVLINDLTVAQRNSLIVCMLYKAGGLNKNMTVKPLAKWLR